MSIRHFRLARWAAPAALTLAITACGGSAHSDRSAAATNGGAAPTVSVKQVGSFGAVLVDDGGHALYASDEEADGKVRCTKSCTAFWEPLRAGASAPTAASAVSGKLAVIRRADDHTRQVTYRGKPLYRFTEDPGPGQVTGEGVMDDFDGTSFTWHAVRSGASADSSSSPSQRSDGY
jgi:predicted lipoprotein with Yx(FWY)xxD motif